MNLYELTDELRHVRTKNAEFMGDLIRMAGQKSALEDEVARLRAENERLTAKIATLREQHASQQAVVDALGIEIVSLKQTIANIEEDL